MRLRSAWRRKGLWIDEHEIANFAARCLSPEHKPTTISVIASGRRELTQMSKNRRSKRFLIYVGIILTGLVLGVGGGSVFNSVMATYHAVMTSRSIINDYVRSHSLRRLQIGAGGNDMSGWLNTDISPGTDEAYLDATKPFPFPDRSFRYVFSEHLIEHLTYGDGLIMLNECYRILASGGKVRIATPNLLKFVQLFQDHKTEEMRRYMEGKLMWHGWPQTPKPECLILNLELRSFGHQFVYDPQTLRDSMSRAGFRMITEFPPGDSDDAELRGVEHRRNTSIRDLNDFETMVLQAVRP
jgi:predicted SAM-dependent methyltransferase